MVLCYILRCTIRFRVMYIFTCFVVLLLDELKKRKPRHNFSTANVHAKKACLAVILLRRLYDPAYYDFFTD